MTFLSSIPGFPGYTIVRDGRVWSHKTSKILKPSKISKYGHLCIALCNNGKMHRRLVHRLVLETFVGPCPDGLECRHLDGNPANNRVENLRWGTRIENIRDQSRHKTYKWWGRSGDNTANWLN